MKKHSNINKIVFFALIFLFIYRPGGATDKNWILSGFGLSLFSSGAKEKFKQYEFHGAYTLPWTWDIMSGLALKTRLNGRAGFINVEDENAVFGSIGPSADFSTKNDDIIFKLGISPTILTRKNFCGVNLGGPLQFTVYSEFDLCLYRNFGIGFRTQHTSNANIYKENHGFNTYLVLFNYYINKKIL